MYRFQRKLSIRRRILGIAMVGMGAAAVVSSSCFFEPRTTLCEASGVRCPPDWFCTAEQDACTQDGCGDGIVTGGEDCDDGNKHHGDGCSPSCTREECGNGTLEQGEACDDGDTDPGDGCSATCAEEACGNRALDLGEQCDTGLADTKGCNFPADNALEKIRCTFVRCGDGHINKAAGEECEEGGQATPTCNIRCKMPVCGDGFYDPVSMEECDSEGKNTVACNSNCKAPRCGDEHMNPAYFPPGSLEPEECDKGGNHKDCNGSNPPGIGNCRKPRCGDLYVNPAYVPPGATKVEECDTGGNSSECNGYAPPGTGSCRRPSCGDGYVNPKYVPPNSTKGEECDDGALSDSEPDACRTNCRAAFCGDGVVDPGKGEQCEPEQPGPPVTDKCSSPTTCRPPGSADECKCK